MRYPLAKPYITGAEKRAVARVLDSGILSIGPEQDAFEKAFAKRAGTRYACAVSSGTTGLHLTLIAAGIKEGDEVITTPFSFVASANVILYMRAKPVFVDIDPLSYNMSGGEIEKKITKKTRAILVVHIFGQTCDMRAISAIAKKHNLLIIEDACESIDAKHYGEKAGTWGKAGVFAFYANKQMTTGEGGMIVTNDKHMDTMCRSLRNQGRAPNMQWLDHVVLGYNYRMDEMSAALGSEQLKKLSFSIRERQKIARWYTKHLAPYGDLIKTPATAKGNVHTWFVYVVQVLKKGVRRDDVMRKLNARGIGSKPYLPSIHLFSFYKKAFGYRRGDFPISESVSDRALALPLYVELTEKDIRSIVRTLISIL